MPETSGGSTSWYSTPTLPQLRAWRVGPGRAEFGILSAASSWCRRCPESGRPCCRNLTVRQFLQRLLPRQEQRSLGVGHHEDVLRRSGRNLEICFARGGGGGGGLAQPYTAQAHPGFAFLLLPCSSMGDVRMCVRDPAAFAFDATRRRPPEPRFAVCACAHMRMECKATQKVNRRTYKAQSWTRHTPSSVGLPPSYAQRMQRPSPISVGRIRPKVVQMC